MVLQDGPFAQLFKANFLPLLRFADRHLGDHDRAEDIVSATFLAAWEQRRIGDLPERAWLYKVASNKIADHYRSTARTIVLQRTLARQYESADAGLSPLDRIVVRKAVLELPEHDRDVILLTYWAGLNAGEIATALGISVAAVWATLSRARRKLRAHLS